MPCIGGGEPRLFGQARSEGGLSDRVASTRSNPGLGGLIGDAGQRLVAAEHGEHIEDGR